MSSMEEVDEEEQEEQLDEKELRKRSRSKGPKLARG